jgi:hypothetical protein
VTQSALQSQRSDENDDQGGQVVCRGFRRGEVCGLPWRDTDLDTARITVETARVQLGWEAVESPVKSAASDGVVALDADTVAVMKGLRASRWQSGCQWGSTGRTAAWSSRLRTGPRITLAG